MDDSRLPIELWERIIDVGASCINRDDGTVVDYPTLRACALVCTAWLPRARYNIFYRVVLRTSAHVQRFISTTPATGCHVREIELGPPRWEAMEGWVSLKEQPSIAALLYANLTGVNTLVLSRLQWLYPRKHIKLMSQFRSVKVLELYYVRFPSPSDLAQVLWSLPNLTALRCVAIYLQYAKRPAAEVRRYCSRPQALQVMKVRGSARWWLARLMPYAAEWLRSRRRVRSSIHVWKCAMAHKSLAAREFRQLEP
ncbi:hypothetical protein L226DRAFT_293250 [Lentinus tigrinus ALCF2SS1-7]|uniref:uncharacterized protein n=1 Tax=Lentinus tigrinus ALCF2SS1-7 TaxID=1328758 RepID=UPI0011661F6B|nr:hypothetical protein L226DRAFT_293250 [Lentinus tigrinus ALCF2SS1-7]